MNSVYIKYRVVWIVRTPQACNMWIMARESFGLSLKGSGFPRRSETLLQVHLSSYAAELYDMFPISQTVEQVLIALIVDMRKPAQYTPGLDLD